MTINCFVCGGRGECAVDVTYDGQQIGEGFVCSPCFGTDGKKAIGALREEHRLLLVQGIPPAMAEQMIRDRIEGKRALA